MLLAVAATAAATVAMRVKLQKNNSLVYRTSVGKITYSYMFGVRFFSFSSLARSKSTPSLVALNSSSFSFLKQIIVNNFKWNWFVFINFFYRFTSCCLLGIPFSLLLWLLLLSFAFSNRNRWFNHNDSFEWVVLQIFKDYSYEATQFRSITTSTKKIHTVSGRWQRPEVLCKKKKNACDSNWI